MCSGSPEPLPARARCRAHLPFSRRVDATLLTIIGLLTLATIAAIVQARHRDRCLKSFQDDQVTVVKKGGKLIWGRVSLYATGIELRYATPVAAQQGYVEQSFILYKEEYPEIEALIRVPDGLSPEEQEARRREIARTARPGIARRVGRHLRNGVAILRDALVQAAALIIGVAKTRRPGLGSQEAGIQKLTSEVVGYAGTAYDPLLEAHLFTEVVAEVTSGEEKRSYCGWLKNYTLGFLEIVDAFGNDAGTPDEQHVYTQATAPEDVEITLEENRLFIANRGRRFYHVTAARVAASVYPLACALPPGATVGLAVEYTNSMPEDEVAVDVTMGLVGRVDLVVPRSRALVRHAADGSEARRSRYIGIEHENNRVRNVVPEKTATPA